MSVAILPLSTSNGWPPSVAGIVQPSQSSFLKGYLITPIAVSSSPTHLPLLSPSSPPRSLPLLPSQSSFLWGYLITSIAVSSSPTHLPLLSPSSPPRSLPLLPSQSSFLWGYLITPIMPNSRFTPPRPPMPSPPPSPPFPSPPSQSSFLWGYLITPIIGGSLADRYGGRPVLAAGLALWSLATLLTPSAAAHSLGALLTVRAVMGLGEGVALPCMNHMVSRYVPENRRAWAVGICFAGFHVGSMLGLLSAPSLMALPGLGLTGPFLIFGALGLLWLALWLLLVPADAAAAPSASAASCAHSFESTQKVPGDAPAAPSASAASGAVSGGQLDGKQRMQSGSRVTVWQLLSHPASWAIIIANTVNNWGYFILLSWMPLYFNQVLHTDIRQAAWFSVGPWAVLHTDIRQAAWFSAGPWAVMAGMGLLAAGVANRMEGRQGMTRTAVRKVMQTAGFLGPAASLLLLTRMTSAPLAALCLTAALGLSAFSQAGWLLNHKPSRVAPQPQGARSATLLSTPRFLHRLISHSSSLLLSA
ncbi:unnamed protein product [Closterium sp. NIES-65]|nr:unnamed protein product [Closterium sp. NIES-65]